MSSRPADLPNMNPLLYPRGNALRREVAEAKGYAERHPGSAALINSFLNTAAGIAPGSVVISGPTSANAVKAGDNSSLGYTVQIRLPATPGQLLVAINPQAAFVSNGQSYAVTGGTVTVSVVNSVPTFAYTPSA